MPAFLGAVVEAASADFVVSAGVAAVSVDFFQPDSPNIDKEAAEITVVLTKFLLESFFI